jgi:predicted ATPase
MLRELADAVVRLTAETPLVLVLEDLHWSDPATIDLLSYLVQRREPARLLLGTYRPEDAVVRHHPVWQLVQELSGRGLCTEVRLEELSAADVRAYATGHLGGPVASALAALLYRHTGGHALFLVHMLEHLAQQGLLVRTAGQWTLRRDGTATAVGIPEQLQHLVTRRLEALPETTRRVLEAAAVTGHEFPVVAVAAGLRWPVAAVDRVCETVAAQGQFLRAAGLERWPDGMRSGRYQFRHALYHQVCYERLGVARRVHLTARSRRGWKRGMGCRRGHGRRNWPCTMRRAWNPRGAWSIGAMPAKRRCGGMLIRRPLPTVQPGSRPPPPCHRPRR